ncbi:MAG: T9SS type A sorting domain-containing protein [bacterium]|nr:T9SS type A sorting domain-containing protein [bacterium]
MKKFILFVAIFFLTANSSLFADVDLLYTFHDSVGVYNEIVGGDTVAKASHTSIDPFQLNDVTYGPLAIPFIFVFDCRDYTSFYVNSNGFITFGPTAPGISNYTPISGNESYEGSISAFGRDLIGVFGTSVNTSGTNVLTGVVNFEGVIIGRPITAATAIPAGTTIIGFDESARTITISAVTTGAPLLGLVVQIAAGSIIRKTEGISPNRIHIIQFQNFRQYQIIGTDDNLNFQIKLFEFTGEIHIVYGNMDKNPVPVPNIVAQVGLRGLNTTDFFNRTNDATLDWSNSAAGTVNAETSQLTNTVFPVSGLTYIFPTSCALPVEMSSFISSVNGRDVTLNWTTAMENNNSGFEIERSSVNQSANSWTNIGFIPGNGTTSTPMSFTFTDRGLNTGGYSYRLKQVDFNGNFEFFNLNNEVNIGTPVRFDLSQNYPNPFNPSTVINYDLPLDGKITLEIFDMSGREVATLVNEFQTAGYYSVNFNGSNFASGMYVYRLTSGGTALTKKMLLVK